MKQIKILVEEKNWKLSVMEEEGNRFLFLENTKSGFCDCPVLHNTSIVYDKPEGVPQYMKERINCFYSSHFYFNRQIEKIADCFIN